MGRIWNKEEEQVLELELSARSWILKNVRDRLSKMKVQRKMWWGVGEGKRIQEKQG